MSSEPDHHDEDDLGWTDEWKDLFDPESEADQNLLTLARGHWPTYMRLKLTLIEAEQRLGPTYGTVRRGGTWQYPPVVDVRGKRERIAQYLPHGRLADAHHWLGCEWPEFVHVVTNGHMGDLLAWSEDQCDDFELDVRDGMSIRALQKRYGLTFAVTRTLVHMIRHTDT